MGTLIRITVWSKSDPNPALLAAKQRFEALDQLLSHYKPTSEINQLKPRVTTKVSRELFTILTFAQRLSLQSRGAFDVTVRGKSIGYQHLALGNGTVTLLKDDMLLDLGAIAKGFANDEASKGLIRMGIKRHLIASSGDILVHDAPPHELGWTVAFQDTQRVLTRRAISTSGNTYQPGHILDPRTGQKITKAQTITVLAPNGMTADALATTCLILNPTERAELLSHYQGVEFVSA